MIRFEQPLKLQKRFVIKCNGRDILEAQAGFVQNIADGMVGKGGVMLLARKSLLMGGSGNRAVYRSAAALSW